VLPPPPREALSCRAPLSLDVRCRFTAHAAQRRIFHVGRERQHLSEHFARGGRHLSPVTAAPDLFFFAVTSCVLATMQTLQNYGSLQDVPLLFDHDENVHDDIQSSFKAAVFGFSDGLTTSLNLLVGIYATISRTYSSEDIHNTVVLLGMAGLFAGASSMACGEWLSAKAEQESQCRELGVERRHLADITAIEQAHMKGLLQSYGLSAETADCVNSDVARLPLEGQVRFHGKFELGIDMDGADSPLKNALCMWACFICGALIPLLPWFITASVRSAFVGSVVGSVAGLFSISLYQVRGHYQHLMLTFLRQLAVGAFAVSVTVLANLGFHAFR
jgi:VIT1/CCC1 family predicted Fe2+/Mn2+ transporter